MLTQINEIKQSFALDQEFVKKYGSSLVFPKEDVLPLFEEYTSKANLVKDMHMGSKPESGTDKLHQFFDETQKLLMKLQKFSSSYLIKDATFIEAMLQVFRERKVFRDIIIENLQNCKEGEKVQEFEKLVPMNLQSLSTQTTRPIFDELKDQTIRGLEAKVQNLKLIIAGLVTSAESFLSRIQREETEALKSKFKKKELTYGDELLEKILQKLEYTNLYGCTESEDLNQAVLKNLEKFVSDNKLISERKNEPTSNATRPLNPPSDLKTEDQQNHVLAHGNFETSQLLVAEVVISDRESDLLQRKKETLIKSLLSGFKHNESADVISPAKKSQHKCESQSERKNLRSPNSKDTNAMKPYSSRSYDSHKGIAALIAKFGDLKNQQSPSKFADSNESFCNTKTPSKQYFAFGGSEPPQLTRSISPNSYSSSRNTSPSLSPSEGKYHSRSALDIGTEQTSISPNTDSNYFAQKQEILPEHLMPIAITKTTNYGSFELISEQETAGIVQNQGEGNENSNRDSQGEMKEPFSSRFGQEDTSPAPNHNSPATSRSEAEQPEDNKTSYPLSDVNSENTFIVQCQNRLGSFSAAANVENLANIVHHQTQNLTTNGNDKENNVIKENKKLFKVIFNKDLRVGSHTPNKTKKTPKKYYSPSKTQMTDESNTSFRKEMHSTKKEQKKIYSKGLSTTSLLETSHPLNQSRNSSNNYSTCGLTQSSFLFERGLKIKTDDRITISDFTQNINQLPLSPEFGNPAKNYFPKSSTTTERVNTSTEKVDTSTERVNTSTSRQTISSRINKFEKDKSAVLATSLKVHVKNYLPRFLQNEIKPLLKKNK